MIGKARPCALPRANAAGGVEENGRGAMGSVVLGNGHSGLVPPGATQDKGNMAGLLSFVAPLRLALDYALPPRCAGCGAIVEADGRFCADCWADMRFLGDPCCSACGLPFEVDAGPDAHCGACLAEPPPWTSARAALAYGDVARGVALRLKYGRRTGLARLMAHAMLRHLPEDLRLAPGAALIVPVPLHRGRLWQRGFNQSLLIARALAREAGVPVDPYTLRRIRATRPLHRLGPKARERMVAGAFALDPARAGRIAGKTILLVDDIHTSGATARACTRILQKGGARAVHLLCWARALPGTGAGEIGLPLTEPRSAPGTD